MEKLINIQIAYNEFIWHLSTKIALLKSKIVNFMKCLIS